MPGLRLYDHFASCNCYKVRLLLANLGRPYERVPVEIFAGDTLTEEYRRINPARTTPVLETDDGRHLPESAAILETRPTSRTTRSSWGRWCAGSSTSRRT